MHAYLSGTLRSVGVLAVSSSMQGSSTTSPIRCGCGTTHRGVRVEAFDGAWVDAGATAYRTPDEQVLQNQALN